jgi:hypothetical protein
MKKLIIYYCFIVVSIMTLIGFISARTVPQILSAILFFPLLVYFSRLTVPRRGKVLVIPPVESKELKKVEKPEVKKVKKGKKGEKEEPIKLKKQKEFDFKGLDVDKRLFLKLIGSGGLTIFLFSIFTKKTHGAFFGSVPGPGTVAIKDTSGAQIDPALHHPTDGYKITELDDSTPAYYGFTDKGGAWFIMKEGASGDYRYTKGASDFTNATTGWPNRASLTYDYFENVF